MRRIGLARVFVGKEPEVNHPGYRGRIACDALGVHIRADEAEMLVGDDWVPLPDAEASDLLLPWHRVDLIEWDEEEGRLGLDNATAAARPVREITEEAERERV